MYAPSRRKANDDPKHSACANCAHFVKVNYAQMTRCGIMGEWHCRKALHIEGFVRGETFQQPWNSTCEKFEARLDPNAKHKNRVLDMMTEVETGTP